MHTHVCRSDQATPSPALAGAQVLSEIRHFLQHDERLPQRTRYAVQFLDGLRQQMSLANKDVSHPEYFECPFGATDIQQYSFREVRTKFGDQFRERFWPMFQLFNCVLPTRAPEVEAAGSLHSFLGRNF